MINIKDKTVFMSAFIVLLITFTGMFCEFILHTGVTSLTLEDVIFYNIVSEYTINFGAAYCIIFVTAWVVFYKESDHNDK